jgi:hypothetical protein
MLGAISPVAGDDGALREFEEKMIQAVDEAR